MLSRKHPGLDEPSVFAKHLQTLQYGACLSESDWESDSGQKMIKCAVIDPCVYSQFTTHHFFWQHRGLIPRRIGLFSFLVGWLTSQIQIPSLKVWNKNVSLNVFWWFIAAGWECDWINLREEVACFHLQTYIGCLFSDSLIFASFISLFLPAKGSERVSPSDLNMQ